MQWEKIHQLHTEVAQLKVDADKHASKMQDIKESNTEELKQMQHRHEAEVAELKSRVVQPEQEVEGLKDAERERQAVQQVKAASRQGSEQESDQVPKVIVQAVSYSVHKHIDCVQSTLKLALYSCLQGYCCFVQPVVIGRNTH